MRACLWCGRPIVVPVTLADIWHWGPLPTPIICRACRQRLQPIGSTKCPQCGRQQATVQRCHDCERWDDAFVNHAIFPYDTALKAYMQQYKFQGDYQLRLVMQPLIREALVREHYDVLVPIPITAATWRTRGFNQVTGWLTGQPFQQVLTVSAASKPRDQSSKTRQERLQTPQPFSLVAGAATVLAGKRVLLLDDVYTTGRTLRHAAAQISLGGAQAVTGLTLAR